jgi:hypothetical protein
VEDNVDQDTGSKGQSNDVGESGYSSEKVGNDDSAIESPLPHLANGDSVLASPASPADMIECTSPLCNGDVAETSKCLVVTIPASPLESMGSPLSPSPVSSEVNIDCSSSISTHAQGDCVSPDCNRPVSRFAFCHDDDVDSGEGVARLSSMEDDSGGTKNLQVTDLCEDISRLYTSFVLVTEPNMNGHEEEQLVCGGDIERIVEEVELEVGNKKGDMSRETQLSGVVTDVVWLNGELTSEMQSNEEVASKLSNGVQSSEMMASEVQSVEEVANWSATILPRYQCDDGECSIQSCLNQFTALELMTGNNKVGCENCTQRQNQGKSKGGSISEYDFFLCLIFEKEMVLINIHLRK